MKIKSLLLAAVLGGSLAHAEPSSIDGRVNDLEKRLKAIENIPAVAIALGLRTEPQAAPTPQSDSPLELVNWKYEFKEGHYSSQSRHWFNYVLKNHSDKPIKLVEGSLLFTDLLGERLVEIKLNPDVKYPARNSTATSGEWEFNQFMSEQLRMAAMKHDDVKATLVIRKVLFEDNSVWSPNG